MPRRKPTQMELFAKKRRRARARPSPSPSPSPSRARRVDEYLPHVAREVHHKDHPVHVTMHRVATGPSFRRQSVYKAIVSVIAGARRKGVRVFEYSIQDNHLHLMVEGRDSADLSNQMRTLFSRIAFAVNAVARRHGKLFRDRHHRHELKKPREVRNALVYILFNDRKHRAAARASLASAAAPATAAHASAARTTGAPALDPFSSAPFFHDWVPWDHPPTEQLRARDEAPTAKPLTWLGRYGWRRGLQGDGRLRFSESPRTAH